MQAFAIRQNIERFRKLLDGELPEERRTLLQRLLAEQEEALRTLPASGPPLGDPGARGHGPGA